MKGKTMNCKMLFAAVALVSVLLVPATAQADKWDKGGKGDYWWGKKNKDRDFVCTEKKTGVWINGDVIVPVGKKCTLINSRVRGDVYALQNSEFFTDDNTLIWGKVRGFGAQALSIIKTWVGGSVSQRKGKNSTFHINLSRIDGYVRFEKNGPYERLQVYGAFIGGDLVIKSNHTWAYIGVFRSTIGGDLKLFDNSPAPPTPPSTPFLFVEQNMVLGDVKARKNAPAAQLTDNIVFGDFNASWGWDWDDNWDWDND